MTTMIGYVEKEGGLGVLTFEETGPFCRAHFNEALGAMLTDQPVSGDTFTLLELDPRLSEAALYHDLKTQQLLGSRTATGPAVDAVHVQLTSKGPQPLPPLTVLKVLLRLATDWDSECHIPGMRRMRVLVDAALCKGVDALARFLRPASSNERIDALGVGHLVSLLAAPSADDDAFLVES